MAKSYKQHAGEYPEVAEDFFSQHPDLIAMIKAIAYVLHGHDNDSYMLKGAANLVRCRVCGELLERPKLTPGFKLKRQLDISATYDGYAIVSRRFFDQWQGNEGVGLDFVSIPEEPGYFVIDAREVVAFDPERRKTRFDQHRPCCDRFYSVAGATPAFLRSPESLPAARAVRTDLMFGSGDEKHPLIIIPLALGNALKRAKLSGLDLSEVLQ